MVNNVLSDLKTFSNNEYAAHHRKFFQTHKGGYGEGDEFWGLRVPQVHAVAKKYYKVVSINDLNELINHKVHEVRFSALSMMVNIMKKADPKKRAEIYKLYMKNIDMVNNWDLVDLSAPDIAGAYLFGKKNDDLWCLASSGMLWRERMSVLATLKFIREGDFSMTLALAEHFLEHPHDLMHKACGWLLREIGKRDKTVLTGFLDRYAHKMPRTMLRYSLEKLPDIERKRYMEKKR